MLSFRIRKKIPNDILRTSIINQLCRNGRTINELDRDGTLQGHDSQREYSGKKVWYNLAGIRDLVSKEMRIHPELLGPNRRNDDFNRKTIDVLSSLRKKECILEWSGKNWTHAFRLANPERYSLRPIMAPAYFEMLPPYNEQPKVRFGEEEDMKRVFSAIITHADMDNTYKFTLGKIILDYCRDNHTHDISYDYLAGEFLKHYWYQVYKFRMKQDFKKKKHPRVIKIMHEIFTGRQPADFGLLDETDILAAKKEILKAVFGHARKKSSLVVPRFQNIPGEDGNLVEYEIFYSYNDDEKMIYLRPEAFDFFKRNHAVLSKALIAEWAKLLEKINGSMPSLLSKIEVPNQKREALKKYYGIFSKHSDCCFYCGTNLEKGFIHVDHFIPWSYIFNDDAWNLVLACRSCNLKKGDHLPKKEFKDFLISRNKKYYGVIQVLSDSLDRLDVGRGWAPEIDNHYATCSRYGFGRVCLP